MDCMVVTYRYFIVMLVFSSKAACLGQILYFATLAVHCVLLLGKLPYQSDCNATTKAICSEIKIHTRSNHRYGVIFEAKEGRSINISPREVGLERS